ncbi:MAG: sirohydrochlorin cobaltochelatase [Treponema sp.]|nr:sirohydrochlorin cobaltochelatase [Treponema sp.]
MKKTIYVDYKLINSTGQASIENKLENLLASGVDEILVKPVLMTEGYEAKILKEKLLQYAGRFFFMEFGSPVLGSPESIRRFVELLIKEIGFSSEYEYCLVGHGRSDNKEYFQLSEALHSNGFFNVEVTCLTGEGNSDFYLKKIKEKFLKTAENKAIQVFPLLINLGHHIEEDIFGSKKAEKKSFVEKLEEEGFNVIKNPIPLSHFKTFKDWYLDENKNIF